jgi:hypothetical protein
MGSWAGGRACGGCGSARWAEAGCANAIADSVRTIVNMRIVFPFHLEA